MLDRYSDTFPNDRVSCDILDCSHLTSLRAGRRLNAVSQYYLASCSEVSHDVHNDRISCRRLYTFGTIDDTLEDCGLTFTSEEMKQIDTSTKCSSSRDSALGSLARNRGQIDLTICHCKDLNAIPPLIKLLRNNLWSLSPDALCPV